MLPARIVLGTDFGAPSTAAAQWITRYLAPDAALHGVHVVDPPHEPRTVLPAPWLEGFLTQTRHDAQQRLGAWREQLAHPHLTVEVCTGHPWEALSQCADAQDADLIVVGPHGDHPRQFLPLGSTVDRLVRTARRPVLVAIRPRLAPPRRVLVGLDDADSLAAVLELACGWSTALGASLHGVHVLSVAVMSHILSTAEIGAPGADTAHARVAASLQRETARWQAKLTAHGASPSRLFVEVTDGRVSDILLRRAEALEADLLVLGREGSGGVRPLLLGSSVNAVLHGAHCPVLIVPSRRIA